MELIIDENMEQRIRDEDEGALDELVTQLSPGITGMLWYLSGGTLTAQDIEEITADSFLKLWLEKDNISPGHMEGYLAVTAKNLARNRMRYNDMRRTSEVSENMVDDDFDLAKGVEDEDAARALLGALDELGEPDRTIILRHYYYCQPSSVIGRALKMNSATVRSRMKRAREKLRKILTEGGFLP